MRIVTAYDLGVFAAQTTTQRQTAHGLGAHVVTVKTAADYERVRSGSGRFPGVMPDEPAPAGVPVQQARAPVQRAGSSELARKEINPFVIRGRVNADQIAARDRAVAGLARPSLDKEYAASGFSGFRLKPVGEYGQASGGATFPLEYQIVATGPDGQEQLINTIKSRNAQTEPDLNPSNINKMVQQGAQRLGMKAGPKPPAPRPQAQPKPDIIQEHLNRWKDSSKSPTGAPNPNIPPPVPQPAPVPAAPAPAPAAPAAPVPAPVAPAAPAPTPMPMPPTLEAGPNGPNAGNYVPPAAPESEPISELAPPTLYPRQADPRSREGQAVDNENARRQEEYDQTLKQRQEVGNSPQDYEERAPAAPPEPESSIVSSRDVTRESAPLDPLPGVDDNILPPPAANPNQALADSTLSSGVLRSSQATRNEAPYISGFTGNVVEGTPNSYNGKLQDQVAGPAMYADPAKQLTQSQRNGKLKPYHQMQDATEMFKIEEQKRQQMQQMQPSINDLGFYDPSYVPPTATPTPDTQSTYGQKGLTKKELATQRSVGNVGKFAPAPAATQQASPVQVPAPTAAPANTADSIISPPASAQKQYAYSPQDAEMVAKDEAAHQAMLQNPEQSAVETGTLMSNKSTARGAPNVSLAGDRIIPQTLNSTSDKINAPLSLGQRFAGPAAYASPAAQYHAENLNSNILRTRTGAAAAKAQAYSMPDMRTADAARQAQRDAEQAGPNGTNAEAYQPPTATPTPDTQSTYGQKGLTKKELATQRSVGNVGKFVPPVTQQAKSAPATAAPTAPSVPVTPPQPPIPTPELPKPTPTPVPPPEPAPTPAPAAPQYRPSAPAAPAYRPPAQAAPAPRQTIGGGLFGRRRR